MYKEWSFASILGVLHAILVNYIYKWVPDPYMDELFHINQTRTYCSGDFLTWNPKITTPPALYILALPLFCQRERFLNSFLLPLCFIGLCRLRRKLVPNENVVGAILTAFVIITLPVLLDTSVLFYTDLLSLTAVIWGLSIKNPTLSAFCFTLSVLTRQTNIIWAAMYCLLAWYRIFDRRKPFSSSISSVYRHTPFIILAASFCGFLIWNEGIVLGDRQAHKPVIHLPQFLYFLAFVLGSSAPIFISKISIILDRVLKYPFTSFCFILFSFLSIRYFTLAHPYLLADNRHFPFYLWRWFFQKHWALKFVPIPLYLLAFHFFLSSMTTNLFFNTIFLISIIVTICPAHLLEFRYFIVSYAIWRLTVFERRNLVVIGEILVNLVVNLFALYLFLARPFIWPSEPNALQRFMW